MRTVRWDEVPGGPVRSIEAGRAGPTVVVLPGLGALGYLLPVLDALATSAHTFLLDVPGLGHRSPRHPPRIAGLAALVASWLTTVPAGPVVLAGHSSGAQVGLRAAAACPDRVRALVMLGPTLPPRLRWRPRLLPAFLRTLVREPPGLLAGTVPYYVRAPVTVLRMLADVQRDEPERHVGSVRCPVLVVRGERDRLSPPEWVERLTAGAPHARSCTVPGAHAFPYSHPEPTACLIIRAAGV